MLKQRRRFLFETDSSYEIGTGHIYRCLSLARALRDQGHDCAFECNLALEGNIAYKIKNSGFKVYDALYPVEKLYEKMDTIILDHYGLTHAHETRFKSYGPQVVVIDDLDFRKHDCDLLINYAASETWSYSNESKRCLLGPKYALVDPIYYETGRRRKFNCFKKRYHVLVSFGGSDLTHEAVKVVKGLLTYYDEQDIDFQIHVVTNPYTKDELLRLCSHLSNVHIYSGEYPSLAPIMSICDIAFVPASVTAWECAANGLPTFTTKTVLNQSLSSLRLSALDVTYHVASDPSFTDEGFYYRFIKDMFNDRSSLSCLLTKMSIHARRAIDGQGLARVVDALEHPNDD